MTTPSPLASDAPAIVHLDVKSPYAFLAVAPLRAMEEELGLAFDWRPLTLNIPSYLGSARLDRSGKVAESQRSPAQWAKVKYAYRDARRHAAMQGHSLRGTEKIWDTRLVHCAFEWVRRQQPAGDNSLLHRWLDSVYPPFWRRELDVEDLAVVEDTLASAGARVDGFGAWLEAEGLAHHDHSQLALFDAGVFGVPSIVVGDEWFFGREHLDRIRWRLTGRHGPEPEIAYPVPDGADPRGNIGKPLDLTSLAPWTDGAGLVVGMDLRCPYAWLALEPLLTAVAELGFSTTASDPERRVRWLPLSVPRAQKLPEPEPEADRGTWHRHHRSRWMHTDLARRAMAQGVSLTRLDDANPDASSSAADAALLAAQATCPEHIPDLLRALYRAWWAADLDAGDPDAVAALCAQVEPGTDWRTVIDTASADAAAASTVMADLGLFRCPAMLLRGQPFQGLEHLPMLRQLA